MNCQEDSRDCVKMYFRNLCEPMDHILAESDTAHDIVLIQSGSYMNFEAYIYAIFKHTLGIS